jgi:DNA primase
MARIPDDELERLKREVSLARLIEAQGLTLTSQGKDLACRCPWHEGDDTPSCIVSPKTNLWHCFGCNAGGSVIDWVMRTHKVSFRHACELLAKEHPALAASVSPALPAPKLSAGKLRAAQSFSLTEGDQALLDQVIDFYHATLKSSPEALAYLDKRGLGSMELIERFRLGYANRTLAYRLAPKQYKAGAELRTALRTATHGRWWAPMRESSSTTCAPARPNICTCRARIAGCSTAKASRASRRSSSAKRSSMR